MAEFQIRTATPDDIASVLTLDRATELLPHWAQADYTAALTQTDRGVHRCLLVAHSSRALVGFAVGMTAIAGEYVIAELESVAVAESARRMGIASALCTEVIAWARSRGAKHIDLEVRSQNAGAIRLYEELGFASIGLRPSYYKQPEDDALIMRRPI